jgi:hypothetical protein
MVVKMMGIFNAGFCWDDILVSFHGYILVSSNLSDEPEGCVIFYPLVNCDIAIENGHF